MGRLLERLRRARAIGLSYKATVVILALSSAAVLFEGIGIAMLLPIVEYIQAGGDMAKLSAGNRYWSVLIDVAAFLSLPLNLPFLLGSSFLAIVLRQAFSYLRLRYNSIVLYTSIHELRARVFSLSLRARTSEQQDELLGQAVNDVAVELPKAIQALYGTVHFISRVLLVLMYLAIMFFLAPWMTLVSLGILALTAGVLVGLLKQSARTSRAITDANRKFATFIVERMRSLRLIRLSGTELAEIDNLKALSARQRDNEIRLRQVGGRLDAAVEPIAILVCFIVLYLGYTRFGMPIAALGMFLVVMMRLLPVTKEAISAYQSVAGQWASLMVIDERLKFMLAARESKGGAMTFEALRHGVRFDRVSYTYSSGDRALVEVTCEFPARRITALVGPSGSGKSTLIDLLPRLRDPTSGTIRFDDVALNEFTVASLRAGIAFVPQQPQIFNVPVAQHIRYGRPEATDAEIRDAARLAGAEEFILRLPQGYETLLGESGGRLSGGQRQRLDLARALVRRSPILIFDEPTSQLDADSEQKFRDALRRIRAETESTVIVVGHRLSTVSEADSIIVLEQGAVIETGNHAELMRRGGWYAKAFAKQHGDGTVVPLQPARVANQS
ncbi:MAG: ABC transporter ATP-binding protein [Alphaproteobacteria bacterium]